MLLGFQPFGGSVINKVGSWLSLQLAYGSVTLLAALSVYQLLKFCRYCLSYCSPILDGLRLYKPCKCYFTGVLEGPDSRHESDPLF